METMFEVVIGAILGVIYIWITIRQKKEQKEVQKTD